MRGNKKPRHAHHGLAVHAYLAQFLLGISAMKGPVMAMAGVVHEDVDGDAGALGGVVNLLRRGRIKEIRDHDSRLSSFRSKIGSKRIKPLAPPRREDEFCAVGGELTRQCHADSSTGPGDQRPFTLKISCTCHCGTIIAGCGSWDVKLGRMTA